MHSVHGDAYMHLHCAVGLGRSIDPYCLQVQESMQCNLYNLYLVVY
jgi:hypothetical protein